MERNYGLTNTEMEIMELLWSVKEPLPFRELIRYANEEWNKNWKKQTLNTYLNHLQKMGLVGIDKHATPHYLYYALCTKEKLIQEWTRKMVQECFDNSICGLVAAFTGGEKLSKEEAEELKKLM